MCDIGKMSFSLFYSTPRFWSQICSNETNKTVNFSFLLLQLMWWTFQDIDNLILKSEIFLNKWSSTDFLQFLCFESQFFLSLSSNFLYNFLTYSGKKSHRQILYFNCYYSKYWPCLNKELKNILFFVSDQIISLFQ